MARITWFALVAVLLQLTLYTGALNIGSFNVQVFGPSKASNEQVMNTLVKIVRRYDIVLIQEIRDKSGKAFKSLMDNINKGSHKYNYRISERLGRTTSKEQYAFIYRQDIVSVKGTYQYKDPGDKFEREPYAVRFSSKQTEVKEFVLAGVHIQPEKAVSEITQLIPTHQAIRRKWGNSNILIMGDLNADCSYVGKRALVALKQKFTDLHWLISDDTDTTVKSTDCAYDRFIISGQKLMKSVVANSVGVFRFDQKYGMDEKRAAAVSDHYPIELTLQPSSHTSNTATTATGFIQTAIHWVVKSWKKRFEL